MQEIQIEVAEDKKIVFQMANCYLDSMISNPSVNPETMDIELLASNAIKLAQALMEKTVDGLKGDVLEQARRSIGQRN
ncbi:MAG: hypothetical protein AAFQ41_02315 [Cyanobacteria bacterium J06623_7]